MTKRKYPTKPPTKAAVLKALRKNFSEFDLFPNEIKKQVIYALADNSGKFNFMPPIEPIKKFLKQFIINKIDLSLLSSFDLNYDLYDLRFSLQGQSKIISNEQSISDIKLNKTLVGDITYVQEDGKFYTNYTIGILSYVFENDKQYEGVMSFDRIAKLKAFD